MTTIKETLEQHEGDAVCCVYHNNYVFSGGADGKIKLWDKELNLIKSLDANGCYIFAMTVSASGKLYSSSCDGRVKMLEPPYEQVGELFCSDEAIESLYCDGDVLYTGDEKGVVSNWVNDRLLFKYNLVEEVKSLAVEKDWIYTVRDLDVVVSGIVAGKSGKYVTRAVLEGKSPLLLLGPKVNDRHKFLSFPDRSGMGLVLCKNCVGEKFTKNWHIPNCHEMIVNALCGDENYLYSGGYDNKMKAWTGFEEKSPIALGEVDTGSCINSICCGCDNLIYIACSDGGLRCAKFL